MNQAITRPDDLDALLNGDIIDIKNLSSKTPYYAPASATHPAPANHSLQSSKNTTQVVPAANSLQNMIGLSHPIYGNGGFSTKATLPKIGDDVVVNDTTYLVIDVEDDGSSTGYQGLTLFDASRTRYANGNGRGGKYLSLGEWLNGDKFGR